MEKIKVGIYVIGGLVCVVYAVTVAVDIVRKRRKVTDQSVSAGMMAFMAFMLAFTPFMWEEMYIQSRIPEGEYRIMADVTLPEMSFAVRFPVDVRFETDADYEDSHYYSGAVEMDSVKKAVRLSMILERVYWTDGTILAEPYKEIESNKDIDVYTDMGDIVVNTGVITQETLGIHRQELINNLSLLSKIEPIVICASCAFGIWQYFKSHKEQE